MTGAILEGLERAGFKTNLGPDGAGLSALINERGGGFYISTPSSSLFYLTWQVRSLRGSSALDSK